MMSFMQQSIGFIYTIGLMIYETDSSTCLIQVWGIMVLIRIIAIQLINAYQAGNRLFTETYEYRGHDLLSVWIWRLTLLCCMQGGHRFAPTNK